MTINTPPNNFTAFARDGLKNLIPANLEQPDGKASMQKGFPQETMRPRSAGGIPPSGKDMNGILNQLSSHQVFLNAGGMYRFDSAYAASEGYAAGSVLQLDDGLSAVISLVDGNSNNPNENITGWKGYAGKLLTDQIATLSNSLIDLIYPVGIIIDFSNINFDPNQHFAGTVWIYHGEGRVAVAYSNDPNHPVWTRTVGSDFGEYEHILSVSELPPHKHSKSNIYNKFIAMADEAFNTNNFISVPGGGNGLTVATVDNESSNYEIQVSAIGSVQKASMTEQEIGNGNPMNIVQPSIVVARWCRIA